MTGFDLWNGDVALSLLPTAIAVVALGIAAWQAESNTRLRSQRWEDRRDLQTERNRIRRQAAELRRLRWQLAQLQGHQPTAQQHLGLDGYREKRPEYGPAAVGPSWCYEPLPVDAPDRGAGMRAHDIAALADHTERFDTRELERLLTEGSWTARTRQEVTV